MILQMRALNFKNRFCTIEKNKYTKVIMKIILYIYIYIYIYIYMKLYF